MIDYKVYDDVRDLDEKIMNAFSYVRSHGKEGWSHELMLEALQATRKFLNDAFEMEWSDVGNELED